MARAWPLLLGCKKARPRLGRAFQPRNHIGGQEGEPGGSVHFEEFFVFPARGAGNTEGSLCGLDTPEPEKTLADFQAFDV